MVDHDAHNHATEGLGSDGKIETMAPRLLNHIEISWVMKVFVNVETGLWISITCIDIPR